MLVVDAADVGDSPHAERPFGGESDWVRAWQRYGTAARSAAQTGLIAEAISELLERESLRLCAGVAAALPDIAGMDAEVRCGLIVGGAMTAARDLILRRAHYANDTAVFERAARLVQVHWCAADAFDGVTDAVTMPPARALEVLNLVASVDSVDASLRMRARRAIAALPRSVHDLDDVTRHACVVRILGAAAIRRAADLDALVSEALRAGFHAAHVERYRRATAHRLVVERRALHDALYASIVPPVIGELRRAIGRRLPSLSQSAADDLAADCANDGWMAFITRIDLGSFEPALSLTGNPFESFVQEASRRALQVRRREMRNDRVRSDQLVVVSDVEDTRPPELAHRLETESFLETTSDEFLRIVEIMLAHPRRGRAAEVLLLRHREGMGAAEIADLLDLKQTNVRQLMHRGMIWWREAALADPRARAWLASQYGDVLTPSVDAYVQQLRGGLRQHSAAVSDRFIRRVEPALGQRFGATTDLIVGTEVVIDAAWRRRPMPSLTRALRRHRVDDVVPAMIDRIRAELGPTTAAVTTAFYGVAPPIWGSSGRRTPMAMLDISRELGPRPTAVLSSLVRASRCVEGWLEAEHH